MTTGVDHSLLYISHALVGALFLLGGWGVTRLVRWARKRPRGALLFMALMPLLSFIPIPPPVLRNIERARQERPKRKEDSGDPPLGKKHLIENKPADSMEHSGE